MRAAEMKSKKIIKKHKKSLIAETITPYRATSFSFEDLLDNIVEGDNLTVLKLIPDKDFCITHMTLLIIM
jgi:hypothetical protein